MSAGSLLTDGDRTAILERLRKVRPDTRPAWGQLDAPRMHSHDALEA